MADDYAGSTSTAGRLTPGGSSRGSVETAGDTDWFRISLSNGQTYTFDLEGSPTSGGTLADPFLRLRDSNGSSLTFDDDGGVGNNSRITFTATYSGNYFLSVGSFNAGETGTYRLSASAPSAKPDLAIANLTLSTNSIPVGGALDIQFTIFNNGQALAVASTAKVYISRDNTFDSGDTLLGQPFPTPSLTPGGDFTGNLHVNIPTNFQGGSTYYIGILADTGNSVNNEISEVNNSFAKSLFISANTTNNPPLHGATGGSVLEGAIGHIGETWGNYNCTGFVYSVAYETTSTYFFDPTGADRSFVGSQVPGHPGSILNNQPGAGPSEHFYTVPMSDLGVARADPGADGWHLIGSNGRNLTTIGAGEAAPQPGDLFRGWVTSAGGNRIVHSGVVSGYEPETGTIWLVDNFFSGNPIRYTDYHTTFTSSGRYISGDYAIYRLDNAAVSDNISGDYFRDTLGGGLGNDTISGVGGEDYLRGNEGNDSISGGSQFDNINGNTGDDTLMGDDGDDWVVGGKDNDLLFGGAGSDILNGNLGNDTVRGGANADIVRGGQNDDVLYGEDGNDQLWGDLGNDTLTPGSGADRVNFSVGGGRDLVYGFSSTEGDRVILEGRPSYSLTFSQGNAVITLTGGDQLVLVGVASQSTLGDWLA